MDKQFLRKYLLSKLDSAQREVEILKATIKSLDSEPDEVNEKEAEVEAEETETKVSPKKGAAKPEPKKGKAKPVEVEAEAEAEETEDADDMFGDEETDEDDAPTVEDVRKVIKSFATKHGKEKALALLKKFKVTAIPDIKKSDYAKVIELAKKHL